MKAQHLPVPTVNHYIIHFRNILATLLKIFLKFFPIFRDGQARAVGDNGSVPVKRIHLEGLKKKNNFKHSVFNFKNP